MTEPNAQPKKAEKEQQNTQKEKGERTDKHKSCK